MSNRLGFHYFADTTHYRSHDLDLWQTELRAIDARWLVLQSSPHSAIPEEFISGLLDAHIQPIVQFSMKVNSNVRPEDLYLLLKQYARWGVKYVIFFDQPNCKSAWESETWFKGDLVERFYDRYLPFSRLAQGIGLTPVFPPLQPGGDYWDMSFLKKTFALADEKHSTDFITNLHMAVSAQSFSHDLSWGKGASNSWKNISPYGRRELGEEDHLGLNTWEWYQELAQKQLNITPKFFLFYYGATDIHQNRRATTNSLEGLVDLALESERKPGNNVFFPENILACMFWHIGQSSEGTEFDKSSFLDRQGKPKGRSKAESDPDDPAALPLATRVADLMYAVDHYLLLPSYPWGIPESTLDRIRPIMRESRVTIGFSIIEAMNARKVSVWNENSAFTEKDIQTLREAGCLVDEQIIRSITIPV